MARSFYGVMMQAARAAERSQRRALRERERALKQTDRERKSLQREQLRDMKAAARDAKLAYLEAREDETADRNSQIEERIEELRSILVLAPEAARPIKLDSLKKSYHPKSFDMKASVGACPEAPAPDDFVKAVPQPGFLSRLFGGQKKYESAVEEERSRADEEYREAMDRYGREKADWQEREKIARTKFDEREAARKAEVAEHNAAVQDFASRYSSGDPEAVGEYFSLVLERSLLPEGCPEIFRLAYNPDSRQLIVEHTLPTLDIVPAVGDLSYVRSKDEIREKPRKKGDIKEIYERTIAGISLRVIHEMFSSDAAGVVQALVFNGVVETISPSTGEEIRPCIVSARVTRGDLSRIQIEKVDPVACLRSLGSISKRPDELAPVRPIIEFDMADPRFIPESDILSGLDSRPNIMDLKPAEFESLVTNLFSGMGLDTKQTRSSRDGGVDAIAFDARPVLGGKIVIQAKRYKNTVGVAAVRDLYGTMINEGANKGILVTTAGYGPDAFEFSKDKPIELVDGPGLLYLLEQQGFQARIIMPVD